METKTITEEHKDIVESQLDQFTYGEIQYQMTDTGDLRIDYDGHAHGGWIECPEHLLEAVTSRIADIMQILEEGEVL